MRTQGRDSIKHSAELWMKKEKRIIFDSFKTWLGSFAFTIVYFISVLLLICIQSLAPGFHKTLVLCFHS